MNKSSQNTITSIESQLKTIILEKYGSIRNFSKQSGIPYSTINNIFERGFDSLGVGTAIKICDCLNVDIDGVARGVLQYRMQRETPMVISNEEMLWLLHFRSLSPEEKEKKIKEIPEDVLPHLYWGIEKVAANGQEIELSTIEEALLYDRHCRGILLNKTKKAHPQDECAIENQKKNEILRQFADILQKLPEDDQKKLLEIAIILAQNK